jgi:membrane protease YdiL (CAAX protease family)
MDIETVHLPGFWRTVRILLAASRKRSKGRQERQQQLLSQRSQGRATDWSGLGSAFAVLLMLMINGTAAVCLLSGVKAAQRFEAERAGKMVVSVEFFEGLQMRDGIIRVEEGSFDREAQKISDAYGGSRKEIAEKLQNEFLSHGTRNLIPKDEAGPGVSHVGGGLPAMVGSLLLLWWVAMLSLQGEGVELDVQRRRHPMWEWLFSHPVPPGAVFFAEMLGPIAANPVYWGAPLFVGIVFGDAYDFGLGVIAAALIGIPVTVAAACAGKAIEIGVVLRCSPRSRGAILGLMGWFGYTSLMLYFVGLFFIPKVVTAAGRYLGPAAGLPWPWLGIFLGERADGSQSFISAMLACWIAALLVTGCAVLFSVWATQRGLSGNFSSAVSSRPSRPGRVRFGRDPLYRKEFLWFARDRSALVQSLLIPVSVAALQLINLRGLLEHAQSAWNYLCGVAIFFGTYFLWILGPKSLQSEGTALWIALTWPRGLESLLKAKAWLWSMISCGLVAIVLAYDVFVFPSQAGKILLVGAGWYFFARSMAEKSVTLVTITSSSGETERLPRGRYWAASLGMLTFAVGVVTAQWQLAIVGIVYSYLTSAAMWQNFRARLPYLYDPWSEPLPKAPTLMHAMIAISVMVELAAVLSVPLLALAGRANLGAAMAFGYGVAAIVIAAIMTNFLGDRDVRPSDIWCWLGKGEPIEECEPFWRRYGLEGWASVRGLLAGAAGGVALGLVGLFYQHLVVHIPSVQELMRKSQEQMASQTDFKVWLGIMAVGFAPFAEEYLFRGLLFRALDREWGGWKAVLGSAAFFAIYHPALSWVPVAMLGAANAMLFKKTGRLAPAVAMHMVYNAVVIFG